VRQKIFCCLPLQVSEEGRRASTRNGSFQSLYGGQFTVSTQLINPKFCVSRPHRRSTTVSLETNPLANLIIGLASKPKKAHGKLAAVDLESDIDKKGDGLMCDSRKRVLPLKWL